MQHNLCCHVKIKDTQVLTAVKTLDSLCCWRKLCEGDLCLHKYIAAFMRSGMLQALLDQTYLPAIFMVYLLFTGMGDIKDCLHCLESACIFVI